MYCIVDTNVLIVANKEAHQASPQCVINCINKLHQIEKVGILVVDDTWRILGEYKNKVSSTGQPGVGDAFFKWILTNLRNTQRCEQVHINELSTNNFAEFPGDPALANFDLSDRKFVAVSLVHSRRPPITNAVDSDWYIFQAALIANGIQVDFICPGSFSGCSTSLPAFSP